MEVSWWGSSNYIRKIKTYENRTFVHFSGSSKFLFFFVGFFFKGDWYAGVFELKYKKERNMEIKKKNCEGKKAWDRGL